MTAPCSRGVSRRLFVAAIPGVLLATGGEGHAARPAAPASTIDDAFPTTPASRAREIVGASHARIERVRELLAEDAGLARASWDWGFGDWESAIGAASHTGRKDIIELLLSHGARPTLFTLATLDEIDALRAILAHVAATQTLEGPHSLSLHDHARAGDAARVMAYLEEQGLVREDPFVMAEDAAAPYLGDYAWGSAADEYWTVSWSARRSALSLQRGGQSSRFLMPLAPHTFAPAGARHIEIRFTRPTSAPATTLTIHLSPAPLVSVRR